MFGIYHRMRFRCALGSTLCVPLSWYSTVVIWSRSFWSFSTSGTRLFAHYTYKYKYLYYSGGFDSIRFRF